VPKPAVLGVTSYVANVKSSVPTTAGIEAVHCLPPLTAVHADEPLERSAVTVPNGVALPCT